MSEDVEFIRRKVLTSMKDVAQDAADHAKLKQEDIRLENVHITDPETCEVELLIAGEPDE